MVPVRSLDLGRIRVLERPTGFGHDIERHLASVGIGPDDLDVLPRGVAASGEGERAPDLYGESARRSSGLYVQRQGRRAKNRLVNHVEDDVPRIVEARDSEQLHRVGAEREATILHPLGQPGKVDRIQCVRVARRKDGHRGVEGRRRRDKGAVGGHRHCHWSTERVVDPRVGEGRDREILQIVRPTGSRDQLGSVRSEDHVVEVADLTLEPVQLADQHGFFTRDIVGVCVVIGDLATVGRHENIRSA